MGSANLGDIQANQIKQAEAEQQALLDQKSAEIHHELIMKQQEEREELARIQIEAEKSEQPLPVAKIVGLQPLYDIVLDTGACYQMTPDEFAQFVASKAIPGNVDTTNPVFKGKKPEFSDRNFSKIVFDCVVE